MQLSTGSLLEQAIPVYKITKSQEANSRYLRIKKMSQHQSSFYLTGAWNVCWWGRSETPKKYCFFHRTWAALLQ